MIVTLQTRRIRSMGPVRAFVEGNESVDYEHRDRESAYAFVGEQLRRLGYKGLGKRDKGTVQRRVKVWRKEKATAMVFGELGEMPTEESIAEAGISGP